MVSPLAATGFSLAFHGLTSAMLTVGSISLRGLVNTGSAPSIRASRQPGRVALRQIEEGAAGEREGNEGQDDDMLVHAPTSMPRADGGQGRWRPW